MKEEQKSLSAADQVWLFAFIVLAVQIIILAVELIILMKVP